MTDTQRRVLTRMVAGLAISLASLSLAVWMSGASLQTSVAGRLLCFAYSALAPLATLIFAVARLARQRFFTPDDIDGSASTSGTERARVLQALLQNTLEQLALALPMYAACALILPAAGLAIVPTAAALFLLGRVLFFNGYAGGAAGRALGFALTFYPTVLLWLAALATALHRTLA